MKPQSRAERASLTVTALAGDFQNIIERAPFNGQKLLREPAHVRKNSCKSADHDVCRGQPQTVAEQAWQRWQEPDAPICCRGRVAKSYQQRAVQRRIRDNEQRRRWVHRPNVESIAVANPEQPLCDVGREDVHNMINIQKDMRNTLNPLNHMIQNMQKNTRNTMLQ